MEEWEARATRSAPLFAFPISSFCPTEVTNGSENLRSTKAGWLVPVNPLSGNATYQELAARNVKESGKISGCVSISIGRS